MGKHDPSNAQRTLAGGWFGSALLGRTKVCLLQACAAERCLAAAYLKGTQLLWQAWPPIGTPAGTAENKIRNTEGNHCHNGATFVRIPCKSRSEQLLHLANRIINFRRHAAVDFDAQTTHASHVKSNQLSKETLGFGFVNAGPW